MKFASKIMQIGLGTILLVILGVAGVGCAKSEDTQSSVDSANADLGRLVSIDTELRAQGVYISSKRMTAFQVSQMDSATLDKTEVLVREFLSRGQNVVDTAGRPDVSYPAESLAMVKTWLDSAGSIQKLMKDRRTELATHDDLAMNKDSKDHDSKDQASNLEGAKDDKPIHKIVGKDLKPKKPSDSKKDSVDSTSI